MNFYYLLWYPHSAPALKDENGNDVAATCDEGTLEQLESELKPESLSNE